MKEAEAELIATFINKVVDNIDNEPVIEDVAREVLLLCSHFPVPGHFIIPNQKNPDWLQNPDINTPWLF
jgi:hypothetical protein